MAKRKRKIMQLLQSKNRKFSFKKILILAIVVGLIGAVGFAYSNAAASVKIGYNNSANHKPYKNYVAVHPSVYKKWKGTVCVKAGGYKFQRVVKKYKASKTSKTNKIYLYYTTKKGGATGSMSKGACPKPKKSSSSTGATATSASKSSIPPGCPGGPYGPLVPGTKCPKPPCKKSNNYKDCNRKELAQKILKHKNVGFDPVYAQDDGEKIGPKSQIARLANGKKAVTTCLGKTNYSHPYNGEKAVDLRHGILKFILSVADAGNYIRVTATSDRCHSSGSNHYKGKAVDLGCSTGASFSTLRSHAAKFGGRNNGEVCPGSNHYHFDF